LILGTIVTLELRFIIQSDYYLILGLILAVLNYIPYFGSIIATAIAVIVVFLTQGWQSGLLALIVLFITQQFDGNVLQPKLMGESFKVSPLLIIFSVIIGGALAGVLGMLAAIPIMIVLKDILENITVYFEKKKDVFAESEILK
jgi:predicted PurR-regulated permease PerM